MVLLLRLATSTACRARQPRGQLMGRHGRCLTTAVLSPQDRSAALQKLAPQGSPFAWQEVDGRDAIKKTFYFHDFSQAWAFMSRTALLAEQMNHHPEWFNVYNTVEVTLTTHDCGGVSEKDIRMAQEMESFASALLPPRRQEDES